ncbi:MAG: hypothetical protein QCI38_07645, partial [Candidatus Thermoplasmatota archaeon]|nr:hypothetical protein [Candidatus Thermoplasmatota archaeon]
FVFSGHGAYDSRVRESLICTHEIDSQGNGYLYDSELAQAFSGFQSQNMFFFFDSCNSGGMDGVAGPNSYVTQTCSFDTWGQDVARYQHGLWTYWFLVWGMNTQGYSELVECFDYAYMRVMVDPAGMFYDERGYYIGRMTPEMEFEGTEFYL